MMACKPNSLSPEPYLTWTLTGVKESDDKWRLPNESERHSLVFGADSLFQYLTLNELCSGTYSSPKNAGEQYIFKAECMVPEPHMWYSFITESENKNEIVVIPRLNPTAYLSIQKWRYVKSRTLID